jgi:hypothetical protein
MKLNILEKKLNRYMQGTANMAEMKQVETWLSSQQTTHSFINEKKKEKLRQRILFEVQYYTDYPLSFPKKNEAIKRSIGIVIKGALIILTGMIIYFFAFHNW